MDINDEQILNKICDSIEKMIEKKVYEILEQCGIECSDYAIVQTDDNNNDAYSTSSTVPVKLIGQNLTIALKNKTGEDLDVGDTVKIYGSRTNVSNRYIGLKK